MKRSMLSRRVVCIAGCVLLFAACGDDGGDEVDAGSDTSVVEGGSGGGGAGAGGNGGAGGAAVCEGGRIEDYCRHSTCPKSPEAVIERVCGGDMFRIYHVENNRCGGKTVHHVIALSHTQYHFDGDGNLVGLTQVGDTPRRGCVEHYITHGMSCTGVRPPPHTLCSDADAGADDAGS